MVKSVQAVITTFTARSQRASPERKRCFQLFKVLAKHGFADCFYIKTSSVFSGFTVPAQCVFVPGANLKNQYLKELLDKYGKTEL